MVYYRTKHCLLTADGARAFMKSQGIQPIPNRELVTQKAVVDFETYKKYTTAVEKVMPFRSIPPVTSDCDTVGAFAIDGNGNVAAATSTGGITAKLPGRVGDSCIIGSGAYADNAVGAVSTTGLGESIMRVCLARRIAELLEKGETADQAAKHALDFMSKRVGGTAGVIVISTAGVSGSARVAHHFTTTNMAWAAISNGCMRWGIDPDQEESSEVKA